MNKQKRLQYIEDRLSDFHISWAETQRLMEEKEILLGNKKLSKLQVEISIAWDDEDEYEHEGYYQTIDDAIEALISLKEMEKDLQESNQ